MFLDAVVVFLGVYSVFFLVFFGDFECFGLFGMFWGCFGLLLVVYGCFWGS